MDICFPRPLGSFFLFFSRLRSILRFLFIWGSFFSFPRLHSVLGVILLEWVGRVLSCHFPTSLWSIFYILPFYLAHQYGLSNPFLFVFGDSHFLLFVLLYSLFFVLFCDIRNFPWFGHTIFALFSLFRSNFSLRRSRLSLAPFFSPHWSESFVSFDPATLSLLLNLNLCQCFCVMRPLRFFSL